MLGFTYRKTGEDGLRTLLAPDDSDPPRFNREDALDGAGELQQAGMLRASAIVTELAAQLPSMVDLRFCPYKPPMYTDQNNVKAWLRSQERRQHEREAKRLNPKL